MQSMIASQQQLIRRPINTNITNNNNNSEKSHNSNDSLNNSSEETSFGNDLDLNTINGCHQSVESIEPMDSTTIGTELSGSGSDVRKSLTKKKRSNNSWLNILNPTYKTRHEEFKRLFSELVPNNERLVVDYSCALQKEILVHGRLYLSLNYISFYANIFKWETSLVIKCRDITSLTKANTARVIPNAIQVVTTSGDRYVFTSFAARDKTYVMLFRIWQNALLDQPMSSAQLWQWVHYSYGEDLGLTSDDDEEYYSDNLVHTLAAQPQVLAQENCDSCNSNDRELDVGLDVYEDCIESQSVSSDCRCESHEGKLILNATFPMAVDRVFELIFTDNKFIHNLHKSRRTFDLCVTQWDDCPKGRARQLTYTVALNHALVKSARTIENQLLLEESTAGKHYTIKSEVGNEGVPYCDTFSTHSLWCLTQDSELITRVRVHARVIYKKSVWGLALMKPMIEKSAIQGITDFCNDLSKQLSLWVQMDCSLGIVSAINDLKANVKNIEYMSTDSSVMPSSDAIRSIRSNASHVSESNPYLINKFYTIFGNIISVSDSLLMKLIFFALLLCLIFNITILVRISKIKSNINFFDYLSIDSTLMSKNPIYLKQFIDKSIEMIKTIESNLIELQNKLKDEL